MKLALGIGVALLLILVIISWLPPVQRATRTVGFHFASYFISRQFSKMSANIQGKPSLLDLYRSVPLGRIILSILVVVVTTRLVPHWVPAQGWTVDTTMWVGILGFYGTLLVGVIAVAHWIQGVLPNYIRQHIRRGEEAGFLTHENSQAYQKAIDDNANIWQINEAAKSVRSGVRLLMCLLFILPLKIWINDQPVIECSILLVFLVWLGHLLRGLYKVLDGSLSISSLWNIYYITKIMHDENVEDCVFCTTGPGSTSAETLSIER